MKRAATSTSSQRPEIVWEHQWLQESGNAHIPCLRPATVWECQWLQKSGNAHIPCSPTAGQRRHLHLQGTACTFERPRLQLRSEAWQETELTAFYCCRIRGHYLQTINQQKYSHLHITYRQILPARLKFYFASFAFFWQGEGVGEEIETPFSFYSPPS